MKYRLTTLSFDETRMHEARIKCVLFTYIKGMSLCFQNVWLAMKFLGKLSKMLATKKHYWGKSYY